MASDSRSAVAVPTPAEDPGVRGDPAEAPVAASAGEVRPV